MTAPRQTFPRNQSAASTTVTCTPSSLPLAGNTLIVCVSDFSATSCTVTDNQTGSPNTYVNDVSTFAASRSGSAVFRLQSAVVNLGTFVITATVAGSSLDLVIGGTEWAAGLITGKNLSNSSASTSATTTTTLNNSGANATTPSLVVACGTFDTGIASSGITDPPTGYVSIFVEQDSSAFIGGEACYSLTQTGTPGVTWNYSSAADSSAVIVSYNLAGAAGKAAVAYPARAPFKGPPGLHLRAIDMWAPSPNTNVVGTISGLAVSSSTAFGSLAANGAISGVIVSQSTANGGITGLGQISGVIASVSTVFGNVGGIGQISGVVVSSSTVNGLVIGSGAISGVVVSTSTANGLLVGSGVISGLAVGTTTVFGFAADAGSVGVISGMAISSSSALGSVAGIGQVSGFAASTTTVTGEVDATGVISGMSVSTTVAYGSVVNFVPGGVGQSLMVGLICNVGTLDNPVPRN